MMKIPSPKVSKSKNVQKTVLVAEKLFWVLSGSILAFISYRFFVQAAAPEVRNISGGVNGISMLIGMLVYKTQVNDQAFLSLGLTVIINIPLFVFGWMKLGKKFTFYTFLYVVSQLLIQVIFQILPQSVGDWISNNSFFSYEKDIFTKSTANGQAIMSLMALVNAVIGGLLYGFSSVFVYNANACCGGTDFAYFYLNIKKGKRIGTLGFIFNTIVVVIGVFILQFAQPIHGANGIDASRTFLNGGVRLIATMIYILLIAYVLNHYYPQQKIMTITLITNDLLVITDCFKKLGINRTFTYANAVGSYSGKQKFMCHIVMTEHELKIFKRYINKHKTNTELFISASHSYYITGKFQSVKLD